MKKFNIVGFTEKSNFLGDGVCKKTRRNCLTRGAWAVCSFKGVLGKREGGSVFEEGLIPQCTL